MAQIINNSPPYMFAVTFFLAEYHIKYIPCLNFMQASIDAELEKADCTACGEQVSNLS